MQTGKTNSALPYWMGAAETHRTVRPHDPLPPAPTIPFGPLASMHRGRFLFPPLFPTREGGVCLQSLSLVGMHASHDSLAPGVRHGRQQRDTPPRQVRAHLLAARLLCRRVAGSAPESSGGLGGQRSRAPRRRDRGESWAAPVSRLGTVE
jgi:hypothetical protein